MALQIQIKRGIQANMPALADGEFYFATDQARLFVGLGGSVLPIGGIVSVQLADGTTPSQLMKVQADGSLLISLGNTQGKANVMKTGTLVTTATTADQVVLTYTVTALKTFFLEYFHLEARLTAASATGAVLGTISLETPSGTKVFTFTAVNATHSDVDQVVVPLAEPIPIAAGTVIRVVVTPAAITSTTWVANFGGYER